MPYYTKKVGNKTCVYKKSNNKKVGCTSGPIENYLTALHMNRELKIRNIFRLIREDKEPEIKKGKKQITIQLNDSSGDFEKLLRWWKTMGDIGHSAVIHCDVEQPTDMIKIYCDGDGADRVQSIKVEIIEDKNN